MGERVPAEGSVGAISYLDLVCQSGKRDPKIVVNWCAPNPYLPPYLRFALDPVLSFTSPAPSRTFPALHTRMFPSIAPASNSRPALRMTQDLLGQLSAQQRTFSDNPLSADVFGQLIDLVQGGTITCECRSPSNSCFTVRLNLYVLPPSHLLYRDCSHFLFPISYFPLWIPMSVASRVPFPFS